MEKLFSLLDEIKESGSRCSVELYRAPPPVVVDTDVFVNSILGTPLSDAEMKCKNFVVDSDLWFLK